MQCRTKGLRWAMAPARNAADVVIAALGDDLGIVSAAAVALERVPEAGGRPLPGEPARDLLAAPW